MRGATCPYTDKDVDDCETDDDLLMEPEQAAKHFNFHENLGIYVGALVRVHGHVELTGWQPGTGL